MQHEGSNPSSSTKYRHNIMGETWNRLDAEQKVDDTTDDHR